MERARGTVRAREAITGAQVLNIEGEVKVSHERKRCCAMEKRRRGRCAVGDLNAAVRAISDVLTTGMRAAWSVAAVTSRTWSVRVSRKRSSAC
jgi:hypothetical protein